MSKSEIDKIKAVLGEINKSRRDADEFESVDFSDALFLNTENNHYAYEMPKRNRDFIVLSANKITNLTKALEIAVDMFNEIEFCVSHPTSRDMDFYRLKQCNLNAKEALKQISEILEVKP